MTIDILFLAKNRLAFTRESFAALRRNTDWSMVNKLVIYDDGSTDGTLGYLQAQALLMGAELRKTNLGSAVTVGNHFIERSTADLLAKIDNDAMYPPGWLEISAGVMAAHPELQLLCLEERGIKAPLPYSYQGTARVGGLFMLRRSALKGIALPTVQAKYWGIQQWVSRYHIRAGWLKPSLPVFLLDRVPFEPWASLSAGYEAQHWQRPMPSDGAIHKYPADKAYLWQWCGWPVREVKVYRATRPLIVRQSKVEAGEQVPDTWKPEWIRGLEARGDIRACMEQI